MLNLRTFPEATEVHSEEVEVRAQQEMLVKRLMDAAVLPVRGSEAPRLGRDLEGVGVGHRRQLLAVLACHQHGGQGQVWEEAQLYSRPNPDTNQDNCIL